MNDGGGARPRKAPSAEAIALLRTEAGRLDVEEILDLCYAFSKDPIRLTVYLDVLRGKGGTKAQAAACLVCFDLARQGETRFEPEFLALIPVIESFSQMYLGEQSALERLIGEDEYLTSLWADLQARLGGRDDRVDEIDAADLEVDAEIVELDLLDDDDILEIEDVLGVIDTGSDEMEQRWVGALDGFYDLETGLQAMFNVGGHNVSSAGGFSASSKADIARIEALRGEAESLAAHVPEARELLPIVDLFLAAHTRAKNLFGRRNKRRDTQLREGLAAFASLDAPPASAAPWLEPPTGPTHAWEKVAELLLDYAAFLVERIDEQAGPPYGAEGLADEYVASPRPQPPPTRLSDGGRRRRR
jgi:hypothetical protein